MTQKFVAEPVDVKKVVDVSPTTLVKTSSSTLKGLMVILGVALIGFCIYFTIRTLFKPKPTQQIAVQSGGIANIINEANKRHLILFAEPYFQVSTKAEENANVGCRVGVRWEF